MKEPVDIQKLRKKRQRNARMKQVLILGLIVIAILSALYINDILVRKNFTSQIGGMVGSVGGDGFPADLPSGTVRDINRISNNIVILKDSNLYIYNNKGKQIENIQQMSDRTLVDVNDDRILYYELGGRTANVHSGLAEVYKIDLESNIVYADIGKSGEVAVLTSPPNFVAEVKVFSRNKPEAIYTRSFTEELISTVAVSPKSSQIALSKIGTDGGILDFSLLIYPLDKDVDPTVIAVGNRMILDINFYKEDTVILLTDKDYLVYDTKSTSLVGSFTFSENTEVVEFRKYSNNLLVLSRDKNTREFILNVLNPNGTSLSNMRLANKPLDFDFNEKSIYILSGYEIAEYNYAMNLVKKYPSSNVERIYAIENEVYLISKNLIEVLGTVEEE